MPSIIAIGGNDDQKKRSSHSREPRFWQKHVPAFLASRLSRAEYCRRQSIPYHALCYWQKKLAGGSHASSKLVPVPIEVNRSLLDVAKCDHKSRIRIRLPRQVTVDVSDGFTPATLSAVLAVLEER